MTAPTISRYQITGQLGVGGMGVVYEAQDTRLPRRVALKFLADDLAEDHQARLRLRQEAQVAAELNHPHICTVYDIDEQDGRPFIVMERIEGDTLKRYLKGRVLETSEIVSIAQQVAEALAAAHAQGIVHRDIKPGNIAISEAGRVKVLDFGLARHLGDAVPVSAELVDAELPGSPLGTANYMAPERIRQKGDDPRSDLFALGVVIYEMATGHLPFEGASAMDTILNVLDNRPIPLTVHCPGRPGAVKLEKVVNRLLAKQPDRRYRSASAVHDALARIGCSQPTKNTGTTLGTMSHEVRSIDTTQVTKSTKRARSTKNTKGTKSTKNTRRRAA